MGAAIGEAHPRENRTDGELLMSGRTEIRMPAEQEGSRSVVRAWLKRIGEAVAADEPLVEIETDKVAVEIPAPCGGVLAEIVLEVGAEAPAGAVLGALNAAGAPSLGAAEPAPAAPARTIGAADSVRLSPLVRRLIADHRIDAKALRGSGRDGRITHKDVEDFIARKTTASAEINRSSGGVQRVPHDFMRRSIAEHMTRSVAVAPHVTAVFEADFSAVAAHRKMHKDAYQRDGAPLTYSAYVIRAAALAMGVSPNVNSRWHDHHLDVFEDANIGIGVALGDKGLIAPVIAKAQSLSLKAIARQLGQLTEKARANKLAPADVQGGTFTISNHGVSGSLLAAPIIINQPQSAILGIGKLEKRVVVREIDGADSIQIRPMAYVSLTIDHRVLDGHQANAWLTHFVESLETWLLED
jgi:2-oxoglutarate dehydrogenase E2 component (dihydrolipoamide succinyltransferase)